MTRSTILTAYLSRVRDQSDPDEVSAAVTATAQALSVPAEQVRDVVRAHVAGMVG